MTSALDAPTWSRMVARRGRADPAMVTDEGTWSGAELLDHAAGAADWLDRLGVPAGQAVPALMTMTLAAAALLVAGAGTGRPLAPVGPRLATPELAACLARHEAAVVVCQPDLADAARAAAVHTGQRVEVVPAPTTSARRLDLDPRPEALALIMHTSGTSGVPKLVPVRQDRLAARVRNSVPLTGVGPGAVYAALSPFQHIAGVGNLLITLAAGATMVGANRFSTETWVRLSGLGVTHAQMVPTMVDTLLDAGLLDVPTLRMLQYGGAPIHPESLSRLMAALPGVALVQIYGATEGSPLTCLTAEDHRSAARGDVELLATVGRPAPETAIRIADPDDRGIGEVLARAPHIHVTGEDGWLHTGDLGRLDARGYLSVVGRQGDRILRGGENVDPVEVEDVLGRHPAVADVAVIGVPDRRLGEVVAAFIVARDRGAPPEPAELRRFARLSLAGFKVPERWTLVERLPRNENGKVLRRLLRQGEG